MIRDWLRWWSAPAEEVTLADPVTGVRLTTTRQALADADAAIAQHHSLHGRLDQVATRWRYAQAVAQASRVRAVLEPEQGGHWRLVNLRRYPSDAGRLVRRAPYRVELTFGPLPKPVLRWHWGPNGG